MSTCGYLCPKCEGSGYLETGDSCEWCALPPTPSPNNTTQIITEEVWLKSVHEGNCCGHWEESKS
ncbi:MAG: hypothetical protein MUE33_01865 [Cytophagaceae bacterium]|nr:hypothetical protein [Cytophagaceae bacterium]